MQRLDKIFTPRGVRKQKAILHKFEFAIAMAPEIHHKQQEII
jgi:hypothetical protein